MNTRKKVAKRAKKRGNNARSLASLSKRQHMHQAHVPSALKDKAVHARLLKLKQEDPSLLDKEDLTKDNQKFIGLAQSLKKLMVRKKRL